MYKLMLASCLMLATMGSTWCVWAQDLEPAADGAVTALETTLQVERTLLNERRAQYRELARKRLSLTTRLKGLWEILDETIANADAQQTRMIDRTLRQIDQAEGELAEAQLALRVVIDGMRQQIRRISLVTEELDVLRGREAPAAGALDGPWEVVLLPQNQRGVFRLKQNGTLIQGTYRLAGGFTGSLQGTLVQSKVYLQRVDSRLGRNMEFEGRLSGDLSQIRGQWQSLELAAGEGSNGQWSAKRIESPTGDSP